MVIQSKTGSKMILKTGISLGLAVSALFGIHPTQLSGPSFIDTSLVKPEKFRSIKAMQSELKPPRPTYEADYLKKTQSSSSSNLHGHYYELGFRPLKSSINLASLEKLSFADRFKIPYKTVLKKDKSLPIPAWQDRLEFDFGRITKEVFDLLHNHYGRWNSHLLELKYDHNKSYKLTDFLPPVVKELEGSRFVPSKKNLPGFIWDIAAVPLKKGQKPSSSLYTNCWGIAYEALRGALDFQIFYARASWILDALRQNSQLLAKANEASSFPDPSTLKTGDIVLISHEAGNKEYFDHTAIVVDSGIYFEKAGSGAQTPIRIIDQENLFSLWQPGVFKYEWRRPYPNANWQDPKKLFSLNSSKFLKKFPGLRKMPKTFLEKHSADWQEEDDGSIHLNFFDMRTSDPKDT